MIGFDLTGATGVGEEIARKIGLLKGLNISYTRALKCIEDQDYCGLDSELDTENALLAEIAGNAAKDSPEGIGCSGFWETAAAYLSVSGADDELRPVLRRIMSDIEIYGRLLKNCGILHEKLVYRVKEARSESQLHIMSQKNRRLINTCYNDGYTPKSGSFIDCKSD